jgi:hypothetical protein
LLCGKETSIRPWRNVPILRVPECASKQPSAEIVAIAI